MRKCTDTMLGRCVPLSKKSTNKKKSKASSTTKNKPGVELQNKQATKKKINPAFFSIDPRNNPIAQHIFTDKIGDAERASRIFQGVTLATAYPLGPVRAVGPHGWVAATFLTIGISLPIISYAQTADQYRDLIQFVNWILAKLEARAERVNDAADNHKLISKLTFILVLGMSYEILGEKVLSIISLLL